MFSRLPFAELIARATTLFTVARDTPEIASRVAPYGYDAAALADALALVEAASAAAATQQAEYADQYAATSAVNAAVATVEATTARHRQLARLAHTRGTPGYSALHLDGKLPDRLAALVQAADAFYRTLEERPDLAAPIRTLTPAALAEARAHVAAAREALSAQARESGEAQQASALRDAAVARLRARAADVAAIARIALADVPQLREQLGLRER